MITSPVARPADYFKGYLDKVYPDGTGREQKVDVGCAFFAGIEAAFRFLDDYVALESVEEEEALKRISDFRRHNKEVAIDVNLSRFRDA